jgi:hypothetical protein
VKRSNEGLIATLILMVTLYLVALALLGGLMRVLR